jgi:hypothetical protein
VLVSGMQTCDPWSLLQASKLLFTVFYSAHQSSGLGSTRPLTMTAHLCDWEKLLSAHKQQQTQPQLCGFSLGCTSVKLHGLI